MNKLVKMQIFTYAKTSTENAPGSMLKNLETSVRSLKVKFIYLIQIFVRDKNFNQHKQLLIRNIKLLLLCTFYIQLIYSVWIIKKLLDILRRILFFLLVNSEFSTIYSTPLAHNNNIPKQSSLIQTC